jgi:hypothetical protein
MSNPRLRVTSRQTLKPPHRENSRFWSSVPALLESEDEQAYLALQSEIEQAIDPKDVFGRIRAQDLTDKIWEERRLKHSYANIIASARVEALGVLLQSHYGEDLLQAMRVAQDYFSNEPSAQEKAAQTIRRLNITPEMINGMAACLRIGIIRTLDEMRGRRENMRRHLMKDHEKQQRKTRKQTQRRPSDDVTSIPRSKRD